MIHLHTSVYIFACFFSDPSGYTPLVYDFFSETGMAPCFFSVQDPRFFVYKTTLLLFNRLWTSLTDAQLSLYVVLCTPQPPGLMIDYTYDQMGEFWNQPVQFLNKKLS